MLIYAAVSDLQTWLGATSAPANSNALLRAATIRVAKACQRNLYTDEPDPQTAAVLNDATCAQAASWVTLGVDPANAGTDYPAPVKSSTILDANVQRDTTAITTALTAAVDTLCVEAVDLLQTAGLLYVPTPQFDATGYLPRWGMDLPLPSLIEDGYGWPALPTGVDGSASLVLAELDDRFDSIDSSLNTIQETVMAYTPATSNTTILSGAPIIIAASATSVQLTAGREHEVTGSAAQTFTAPSSPVAGAIVNVKVIESYTGSGVTMPTGMQQVGTLAAGQDFTWVYDGSVWLVQ